MALRRFFISPEQLTDPNPSLWGDEARHLLKVLRLGVGEEVILFDNSGLEYRSRIRSVSRDKVVFDIEEKERINRESPLRISLGLPLIRSQPLEWILQKGTELGVSSFYPFYSAHSSRNFQKREQEIRMNRWQKIVQEAAKQCRRNMLPAVHPMISFIDLLEIGQEGLKIILHQEATERTMRALYAGPSFPGSVFLLVGPEGGFPPEEVNLAERKEFISLSLGPRILRSETAALALISLCQFLWGDMGAEKKGGEDAVS